MNVRQLHKNALKNFLLGLNAEGQSIAVYDSYKRESETYPYISILSSKLDPNRSEGSNLSMKDNRTYERRYEYELMVVFAFNQKQMENLEKAVDAWEDAILNLLQSQQVRDGGAGSAYYDLGVTGISELFNGSALALDDNYVIKFISVEIKTSVPYV